MPCKLHFSFVLIAILTTEINIQYRVGKGTKREMNLKLTSLTSSEHPSDN